jgi:hypothetical protein
LAVAEYSNNRVSLWPLTNPSAATLALGQPDLVSSTVNNGRLSARSLKYPAGIAYANSKLVVSDAGNNRVFVYDTSGFSKKLMGKIIVDRQIESLPYP